MSDDETVLKKIKNGVFVVTYFLDGKEYGITTAWVNRVSFKPNMIIVSIGKNRKGYNGLLESEAFCINILGDEHLEIARHFGLKTGENLNNFKDIVFMESESGSPMLKDCVGALDCKLAKKIDIGDHVIIVGEVVSSKDNEGESMVFNREDFP